MRILPYSTIWKFMMKHPILSAQLSEPAWGLRIYIPACICYPTAHYSTHVRDGEALMVDPRVLMIVHPIFIFPVLQSVLGLQSLFQPSTDVNEALILVRTPASLFLADAIH